MKVITETENPVELYKLLIGAILPRPIAWVSSISREGIANLAPFSFFTIASVKPPVLCFTPITKSSAEGVGVLKDTATNILQTKDFVVHVVNRNLAEAMNVSCGNYPPEVDEFEIAGLTKLPSDSVAAPRMAEAMVAMECRLREVIQFGDTPMAGNLVLGDIICIHINDAVYREGKIDTNLLQPIARLAGDAYSTTSDQFEMQRP